MIDKKILKEFLRLKWNETKWGWIIGIPVAFYYKIVSLPYGDRYWNEDFPSAYRLGFYEKADYFMALIHTLISCVLLAGFIGICYGFILWLKCNWRQATINVYGKKRKKK